MNIIGLDASGKNLSLSLRRNGEEYGRIEQLLEHIELLPAIFSQFCREYSLKPEQIDAFSLIRGPGSYTGLRGSLLLAKSLAMLKGVKITTRLWHELVLYACRKQQQQILVSLAVRQNQYYLTIGCFRDGDLTYDLQPQLVTANQLLTEYQKHLCPVAGDWPETEKKPSNHIQLGHLGAELAEWTESDFCPVPPDMLVPFYVRPAVRPL